MTAAFLVGAILGFALGALCYASVIGWVASCWLAGQLPVWEKDQRE